MTFHYLQAHLHQSMWVGCYWNYREENWTSQGLTPVYAVMKCYKASWEVPGHSEGAGAGSSLRLETCHLKSAGDCPSCELPKSLHVARKAMGDYFPKTGPAVAGLPSHQGEVSAFSSFFFLQHCFTQWQNPTIFPGQEETFLFLFGSGWLCSLPPASSPDTLRFFSSALQSLLPGFSYWCERVNRSMWRAIERTNGLSLNTWQAGGKTVQLMRGCWWTLPSSHILFIKMSHLWNLRHLCLSVPKDSNIAGGKP